MNIGNKYKIESDALNITLFEKARNTKGEVRWDAIGYFSNVQNALKFLVDLGVRESQLIDLKTTLAKVEELYTLINNLSSTHKQSVTEGFSASGSDKLPKQKKKGVK